MRKTLKTQLSKVFTGGLLLVALPVMTGIGMIGTVNAEEESSVTVTSPDGGEEWQIGETYEITWTQSGVEKVDINLVEGENSYVVVSDYTPEETLETYTYSYTVASDVPADTDYKISMTGYNTELVEFQDESDNYFTIVEAEEEEETSITVTSPNGEEEWEIGKQYTIEWTSTEDIDQVTISLNKADALVKDLASDIDNDGNFSWTPDMTLEVGDDYKIKITQTSGEVYDESDNYFSVANFSGSDCLPDGSLIKDPTNPKIYVIQNCERRWIRTQQEFKKSGYSWKDVQEVDSETVAMYEESSDTSTGLLKGANSSKIYRIVNGKIIWIPTVAAFNSQGLKWEDVEGVSETTLEGYPEIKLITVQGDPRVYYLTENGLKKHIPNPEVFNSYGNKWEDIVEVSEDQLEGYEDVDLIQEEGDVKVYKLENGKKRWIKTANAFNRLGFEWGKIVRVNSTEINTYSDGTDIE